MTAINKKHPDLTETTIEGFCEEFGADYQVITIKSTLIKKIKDYCEKKKISQRKLASMVDGLTHDRVSKIFNGRVAHMSVDKLLQITHVLDIIVNISFSRPKKKNVA